MKEREPTLGEIKFQLNDSLKVIAQLNAENADLRAKLERAEAALAEIAPILTILKDTNLDLSESEYEVFERCESRSPQCGAALLEKVKRYELALDKLARLGNEPHYGNSVGNVIAKQALAETEDAK